MILKWSIAITLGAITGIVLRHYPNLSVTGVLVIGGIIVLLGLRVSDILAAK